MRPLEGLSPHLEGLVGKRASFDIHVVSLVVWMVLYMFVTVSMVGYRFFEHFTDCPDDGIDQTFTVFFQS